MSDTAVARQIDERANQTISAIAGLLILGALVYGLFLVGRKVYYWASPPPTLTLSARIEGQSKPFALHIEGAVQRGAEPLTGLVLLAIERVGEGSPESFTVPVEKGNFKLDISGQQAALQSKEEYLYISAEAWTKEHPHRPTRGAVYLNASGPWRYRNLIFASGISLIIALGAIFCWVFTGSTSGLKNRAAIILSYCVMGIFLIVPLIFANTAMRLAPTQFEIAEPVGLTVAKPWGAKADDPAEWVFNIGGHFVQAGSEKTEVNPAPRTTGTVAGAANSRAVSGSANPQQLPSTGASGAGGQVSPNPAAGAGSTADGASSTGAADSTSPAAATGGPTTQPNKEISGPEGKELKGGIAIPFYVVVLGVIGGAVNMTRQIPKYHREGEQSVIEIKPLQGWRSLWLVKGSQSITTVASGQGINSSSASATQPAGNAGNSEWREGLLNQYMYLVSAPFLAMITYFLMAWLGLTTVPALVLIAFSVGLITEPVIDKIIEVAQGFLKNGKKPATKAGGQQIQQGNPKQDAAPGPKDGEKSQSAAAGGE